MKKLDELLYEALSPTDEMSDELKQNIRKLTQVRKEQNMGKLLDFGKKRKRVPAAAAVAAAVLCFTSVTAFAAWRHLSASDVASEAGDGKLAEAFLNNDSFPDEKSQSCGGYDIALLGLISGKDISDQIHTDNGEVVDENTYAVVAISNTDGTPMPDTSSEEYGNQAFLVSPYIEGYDPARYNIFTLKAGGYSEIAEDGIWYRIMEVENIEAFADHTIYLGVTDGTFYNRDAFIYDRVSGEISRNKAYEGVNALFTLPIDPSKADTEKAAAIMNAADHPVEEKAADDLSEFDTSAAEALIDILTPETIETYAEPVESTRQILTPNERGEYSYHYQLPNGASGSGTAVVKEMFPD